VNVLREWRLACPRRDGELVLVFPNERGRPQDHSNILSRGFWPLQIALGITRVGESGPRAKYSLHALRHAAASLFIEEGMNAKRVQTLMGHASIVQTFDRYGHLFADVEADQRTMARIQARLLA
jgi:integrase